MKRRVVITGLGAVTPIGNNVEIFWNNVKEGKNGIEKITLFDASKHRVQLAAEVKNLNFEEFIPKSEIRKYDRYTQFAVIAADECIKNSGLDISKEDASRIGVLVSSGIGGLGTIAKEHSRGLERGFDNMSPYFVPMSIANMAAGIIAIKHKTHGMCSSVVTACASATNAIGDSFRQIRDGYAEMMICGGSEASINEFGIGGFSALRALNDTDDINKASIPFDKDRKGFVMGEGAGILLLEEYEHAVARNANIICEVVGYGSTCDAYHMTAPDPEANGACESMKSACKDAGISTDEVDYINAHGTSTALNDKGETLAIKKAFGEKKAKELAISSTKSMTGHLLGASGAIEAIVLALSLKDSFIPATINYKNFDEDCDLDIVPNIGRSKDIKYALSNSLGFGGHNATILFKKA